MVVSYFGYVNEGCGKRSIFGFRFFQERSKEEHSVNCASVSSEPKLVWSY